ncbi:(E3-independent) E2 ubiquitin-conjugating enzyme UBE2O [Patella vulgata]|uniref:(E3-independent) E2 ubiquitin-conjugating enzyme UBE2O n=1 Tax=Patella vulgata TaxID=6465 RepID=UPI00217FA2D5|nr:(E3-independent) E2 ubiquitin-conjugating enzyme UBE2O [Patella vulgata]
MSLQERKNKKSVQSDEEKAEIDQFLKNAFDCCMMCNGFYGGSFGQPVCSTCHLFLFSGDINNEDGEAEVFVEKADSDDSGTEEPGAEDDFYTQPELGVKTVRAIVSHKADKLAERLTCLTVARDRGNVPEGLIDSLPPEVLLVVFKHLDDISLWTAGNVCRRWRQILDGETSEEEWKHFIQLRWPLFMPQYKVKCWKIIYTNLLNSSPCRYCLESMMLQSTPPIEENSWRHRRLRSELKTLKMDPPEGIQATPLDRHCCHWQASITGPHGSPYEGGIFLLYLQIPQSYPMRPPKVRFITKIFHPNISRHGDVGLDSIHHNWSLALTISKVLISIQSLLTDPFINVCMEPTIGRVNSSQRSEFDRIARRWTWKYAMHDFMMPCLVDLKGV